MTKLEKRIRRLFNNPRDCSLQELLPILAYYGFNLERIRGSHHYFKANGELPITIPVHNGKIKKIYLKVFIRLVHNI